MLTLDNDKGTHLGKMVKMRCTLLFDSFCNERLMIVADCVGQSRSNALCMRARKEAWF